MLRVRSFYFNGFQDFIFIHGFRQLVLYSTSTELKPNFANYLVENLGFSTQQALSTSSKLKYRLSRGTANLDNFDFIEKANSVIIFLSKLGLQQSHLRNVVVIEPRLLLSNIDKTLTPKTENFQKLGFSKAHVAEIVSVNPSLLLVGLNTSLIPSIQALMEIMGCVDHVVRILKKFRRRSLCSITKCFVPNIALLQSYGISIDTIRKVLVTEPFSFLRRAEYFQDAVIRVEESLGIPRTSSQFIAGVKLLSHSTEKSIESKKQVYRSFGWTDSDVARLVVLNPSNLSLSEDNIKKKLSFFMNELSYEPSFLASRCNLFTCSLEKRIVPRHKVLVALKENGLKNVRCDLATVVNYSESHFLKKFVLPFKEVHEVYSKHAGVSLEMLTVGSLEPNPNAK